MLEITNYKESCVILDLHKFTVLKLLIVNELDEERIAWIFEEIFKTIIPAKFIKRYSEDLKKQFYDMAKRGIKK